MVYFAAASILLPVVAKNPMNASQKGSREQPHKSTSEKSTCSMPENFVSTSTGGLSNPNPVSEKLLHVLKPHFKTRTFKKGAHLIEQGSVGASLFFVERGTVDIYSDDGKTFHRLDTSKPGEFLGEMSLLTGERRSASAVANEAVTAQEISAATMHALVKEHKDVALLLTQLVAIRLGSKEYDALAGKTFAGYSLIRFLGKGGMGIVYEAYDTENENRVALKMMSHFLVYDEKARCRFEREFEIVRSFDSPFIVKTYSKFEAFHTYFLVLEFCDGRPLNDVIVEGPINENAARKIFDSIAKGLQYAHERGVVHRDVKPANIMECHDGAIKLMDFGLAIPIENMSDDEGVAGTFGYLAPEVLQGEPPTKSSDYFALGMTILELLNGKKSFAGCTHSEVIEQFINWSKPDVASLRPDISEDFCKQVDNLLSANPDDRTLWL